jgi:hypothetical protein
VLGHGRHADPQSTRRAAALAAAGEVVTFPKVIHPRAGLSRAEWRALSSREKLERLFGMSLDRAAEILCWGPLHELDSARLNAVVTIVIDTITIARGPRPNEIVNELNFREHLGRSSTDHCRS